MEVKKEYLKFYVETERRNGMSPTAIYQKIVAAWGEEHISLRSVQIWCRSGDASGGAVAFAHGQGAGRPRSSRTEENVNDVKDLVTHCPHLSVEEIADLTDISSTTIFRILREDLLMKSVIGRWVPHDLTEEQKEKRVNQAKNMLKILNQQDICSRLVITDEKWVYHRTIGTKNVHRRWIAANGDTGDRTVTARRTIHDAKTMILVAICFDGKFVVDILRDGETVDSNRYVEFLKKVHHTFSRRVRPLAWEEWLLQHDNARPHTSRLTNVFLVSKHVTVVGQPPYSPDYNLLDRWVFSKLENSRRDTNFVDENDVLQHVTDELRGLQENELKHQFAKLKSDLQDIIASSGDYL